MLSLAHKVSRAARFVFARREEQELWTIAVRGRVTGLLVCDGGAWRLSWFAGADPRLVNFAGSLDSDVEALAATLGARLGIPVELESLPV